MNLRLLILVIMCLTEVAFVLWVYLKGQRSIIKWLFTAFVLSVALWTLGNYLVYTYVNIFLGYLTFAAATWIALSFLLFSKVFPEGKFPSLKQDKLTSSFILLGVLFTILSFTSTIVKSASLSPEGILQSQYGPAHPWFGIYFLASISYALGLLAYKWRRSKGLNRVQIQFIFLGVLFSASGATTTNLLIPLFFHTSRYSVYGPYFGVILIGFIAHAIVRYRFMNIRLVIRKGTVVALSALLAAGVVLTLLYLLSYSGHFRFPTPTYIFFGIGILAAAFLIVPLRSAIQTLLDRYFYRSHYDYYHTIEEASRKLSSFLDLDLLLDYILRAVQRAMAIEWAAVYLATDEGYRLEQAVQALEPHRLPSELPDPLTGSLRKQQDVLVREEIRRFRSDPKVLDTMEEIGCEMAVPLVVQKQLVGAFLLGPKRSGDAYFSEDISLLTALSGQAAVAIHNAQLYRKMRWMKEYSESILKNMQGGVVTVDADQKIVVFNPAAERLTGRPAKEVLGKPLSVIDKGIAEPLREALEEGKVYTHREGMLNDHTPPVPIIFSTSLLHDPSGRHGAVMVFSDLSYVRRLEQERSLAERMVLVGTMAAELAHEIKNPLVSIRTFAELLPERHEDPEFRRYFQEVALKELDRINALIAQLSETARPPSFQKEPINLREVLEYTLMLVEERAKKSGVHIVRNYEPDLPQVIGEATRMRQLLLNLLYNALEAMPEGGTLTVSAARGDGTWDGYVEVRIRDTGKGVPKDKLDRVFEPFFSTKEGGMGLGLTICRRIVRDFKGDLQLKNNPDGRGVTACVRLPILAREEVIGAIGTDPHRTS
ncbi:MAG: hypothetical protein DRP95_00860 [Candidatus Latescibacterota bacterium]|nr:MAG: hypothetical protein DRP95_00860 [Candidatus Latescibacterota bacterium]